MIEVHGLCKTYPGGAVALQGVSFRVQPGEVLGFLGPNGAGKTTAMRILAGFLRPTGGRALICGCDVAEDSLRARQHLGYLPEQVPLYRELRIHEYLRYRAQLRGLPRRGPWIAEAMAQVGLVGHEDQLIGQLSKGYRQRVGLADALLSRPRVLILDEPTDGLDPNQRREVLQLITELSRTRAVILSTHVLPEVERICQQVVIIHRGRVVAQGTPGALSARLLDRGKIEVVCRGVPAALRAALEAVPGVCAVHPAEPDAGAGAADAEDPAERAVGFTVELTDERVTAGAGAACEELARAVLRCGQLQRLTPARSDLEAVFRFLTSAGAAAPEVPLP